MKDFTVVCRVAIGACRVAIGVGSTLSGQSAVETLFATALRRAPLGIEDTSAEVADGAIQGCRGLFTDAI